MILYSDIDPEYMSHGSEEQRRIQKIVYRRY